MGSSFKMGGGVPKGPQITTVTVPNGTVGIAYSFGFSAVLGTLPYTWTMLATSDAVGWPLSSLSAGGVLSNSSPGTAELVSIRVQVMDAAGLVAAQNFSFTIVAGSTVPGPQALWDGFIQTTNLALAWWPPVSGTPDGYRVYRGTSTSFGAATALNPAPAALIVATTNLSGGGGTPQYYIVDGTGSGATAPLSPGVSYYYWVTASTGGVESAPSGPIVMTTLANGPVANPTKPVDPGSWIAPFSLPTGTVWTCTNLSSGSVAGTGTRNATGCSYLYALQNATPNDVIVLTAGATYPSSGVPYPQPANATGMAGWIYVISSETPEYKAGGALPAYTYSTAYGGGNYVTPGNVGAMPTIVGGNTVQPLSVAGGSTQVRYVGINFTQGNNLGGQFVLISTSSPQYNAPVVEPEHFYFDRCLCGNDITNFATFTYCRHTFSGPWNHMLVHQCYVYGASSPGATPDSQAFFFPGGNNICIENCYLESMCETILCGGAYVTQGKLPSNITVRYTNMTRPSYWQLGLGNGIAGAGNKNHVEYKSGQIGEYYGNVFLNMWPGVDSGQEGFHAFLLGEREQTMIGPQPPNPPVQTCPWGRVTDIDIHDNLFYNQQTLCTAFTGDYNSAGYTARVRAYNNQVSSTYNPYPCDPGAQFTASIAGNTMTVTAFAYALPYGGLQVGGVVYGAGSMAPAAVTASPSITTTCNTVAGSTTLSGFPPSAFTNMPVAGAQVFNTTGIPNAAVVIAINPAAGTMTLGGGMQASLTQTGVTIAFANNILGAYTLGGSAQTVASQTMFGGQKYQSSSIRVLGPVPDYQSYNNTFLKNRANPALLHGSDGNDGALYGTPLTQPQGNGTPNPYPRKSDRTLFRDNLCDNFQICAITGGLSGQGAVNAQFNTATMIFSNNLPTTDSQTYTPAQLPHTLWASLGLANYQGTNTTGPTVPPATPSDWNITSGTFATASSTGGPIGATMTGYRTLKVGSGGWCRGLNQHSDGTLVARTDTNGAYLWTGSSWSQLVNFTSLPASLISTTDIALIGQGCFEIQMAATSSSTMYMMYHGLVFKSTNKGTTWTQTAFAAVSDQTSANPNDSYGQFGQKIAIDPANSNIVFVGTAANGLYFTANGGTSWSAVTGVPVGTASTAGVTGIVFDPSSAVVSGATQGIYAASYGNGVYHSTNGGSTWTLTTGGPTTVNYAVIDTSGNLYVPGNSTGGNGAPNVFKYNGTTWSTTSAAPDGNGVQCLAINPFNQSELVAVQANGTILHTANAGSTWTTPNSATTLVSTDIPWIKAGNLVSGTGPGFYLTQGGCAFSPTVNGQLTLSAGTGVWISQIPPAMTSTTALTYTDQSVGIEQLVANAILIPPTPGAAPILASWDRPFFKITNLNTYPSTYGSVASMTIEMGWSLDYASSDPRKVFGISNWNHFQSGLSTDGGATWTYFPTQYVTTALGGTIAASTPTNLLWAPANRTQPAYSTDGGTTWTGITLPGITNWANFHYAYYLKQRSCCADRVTANTFYLYYANASGLAGNSSQGVYKSTNSGATWTLVHSGNIETNSSLAGFNSTLNSVPGNAGHLFYTSGPLSGTTPSSPVTSPFFRSTDGGVTWTQVANVNAVSCFCFGEIAPLQSYPSIYIVGFVSGLFSIWRSDDNANTWINMGYPTMSLDLISCIASDPYRLGSVYVGYAGGGYAYI